MILYDLFQHVPPSLDYSGPALVTFKAGTPACAFGPLGRTMRSKMDVSPSGVWPLAVVPVVPWRQVLGSAMVWRGWRWKIAGKSVEKTWESLESKTWESLQELEFKNI